MDKDEFISAFAFKTGKQIEELIKEQTDNPRYPLFKHIYEQHGRILLDSELDEILTICRKIDKI